MISLSIPDRDLFAEFSHAVGNLTESHFDWFRKHGIGDNTLFGGPSLAGAGRVRFEGSRYQPTPDGHPAVIVGVGMCDELGWHELHDLAAYAPSQFTAFATRRGAECLLGRHHLEAAQHYGDPIALLDHPHDWLVGGGRGICILDWTPPLASAFQGVKVLANDGATGQRLYDAIDRELSGRKPEIKVAA